MTYKEQIRSPQWIEFATRFKKSKGWQCEACGASQSPSNELSVHHIYYVSGMKMWEHPDSVLECLCSPCHKRRQDSQQRKILEFAASLRVGNEKRHEAECSLLLDPEEAHETEQEELLRMFPSIYIRDDDAHKESRGNWVSVVEEFSSKWPLQSGYLNCAAYNGVEGKQNPNNSNDCYYCCLLVFRNEDRMSAESLLRPITKKALEEIISKSFECPGMEIQIELLREGVHIDESRSGDLQRITKYPWELKPSGGGVAL